MLYAAETFSEISSGTYFCYRLSKLWGHGGGGRISYNELNSMTSSGVKPMTFQLVA
jgi:hypothetical protein